MDESRTARHVAILIFDHVEVLVMATGNLGINPSYSIRNCPPIDILIVPGGRGARKVMNNETMTDWIREVSSQAELVLSVCTGALILAKAHLLDGLKLTTNRLAVNELREVMPESAEIIEEARYIDNGKIILSAGISAGIDMSLYVVSKIFGEERAVRTAKLIEYDWKPSNE